MKAENNLVKENGIIPKETNNKLLIIIIGLFLLIILVPLFISFYYNIHFYMNTIINGIDVSNMTVEQAEEAIQEQFRSYSLSLKGRNGLTGQIHGEDFDISAIFDGSLEDLLEAQNSFFWLRGIFKTSKMEITTMPEYDEALLKDLVSNLLFFKKKI